MRGGAAGTGIVDAKMQAKWQEVVQKSKSRHTPNTPRNKGAAPKKNTREEYNKNIESRQLALSRREVGEAGEAFQKLGKFINQPGTTSSNTPPPARTQNQDKVVEMKDKYLDDTTRKFSELIVKLDQYKEDKKSYPDLSELIDTIISKGSELQAVYNKTRREIDVDTTTDLATFTEKREKINTDEAKKIKELNQLEDKFQIAKTSQSPPAAESSKDDVQERYRVELEKLEKEREEIDKSQGDEDKKVIYDALIYDMEHKKKSFFKTMDQLNKYVEENNQVINQQVRGYSPQPAVAAASSTGSSTAAAKTAVQAESTQRNQQGGPNLEEQKQNLSEKIRNNLVDLDKDITRKKEIYKGDGNMSKKKKLDDIESSYENTVKRAESFLNMVVNAKDADMGKFNKIYEKTFKPNFLEPLKQKLGDLEINGSPGDGDDNGNNSGSVGTAALGVTDPTSNNQSSSDAGQPAGNGNATPGSEDPTTLKTELDDVKKKLQELTMDFREKNDKLKLAELENERESEDIQKILQFILNLLKETLDTGKDQLSKEVSELIQKKKGEIDVLLQKNDDLDIDAVLKQVDDINKEVSQKTKDDSMLNEIKINRICKQLEKTFVSLRPFAAAASTKGGRKTRNKKKKKKSKAKKNKTRRRRRRSKA
jgi:hypothetical protein